MITAKRRSTEATERPRLSRRLGLELQPADELPAALGAPSGGGLATVETPVLAAAGLDHAGEETGLLVAFVVTTLVMVVAIVALAVLHSWWPLVPVVLVHWSATYVVLARINGLLSQ